MEEQAVVEQAVLEHMEEQAVVEQAVDVEDMEEVRIRFPNDQSFDQVKKNKTGMWNPKDLWKMRVYWYISC